MRVFDVSCDLLGACPSLLAEVNPRRAIPTVGTGVPCRFQEGPLQLPIRRCGTTKPPIAGSGGCFVCPRMVRMNCEWLMRLGVSGKLARVDSRPRENGICMDCSMKRGAALS